jgi:hypothetical protein
MFWVWRDANEVLHASSFKPTSGEVEAVIASTARDALLPLDGRVPKHLVEDANDPSKRWEGRCSQTLSQAAS